MQKTSFFIIYCIAFFLFTSCAHRQETVTVETGKTGKTIAMKASDYKFEPNDIKAHAGDTIALKIENISKKAHNFTLRDPRGNILQNVDLPSGQTVTVSANLPDKGVYEFHCDKPFHSTFGMKGKIEVIGE